MAPRNYNVQNYFILVRYMSTRLSLQLTCVAFAALTSWSTFAADGSLHASLVSKSNDGGFVPAGARGVQVLSLNLTRDCTGMVSSLRKVILVDEDTGELSDIAGVSISVNGARITKEYFIDPMSRTVTVSLPSTFVMEPCSTTQLDVDVSVSSSAKGSKHVFSVELATDIVLDSLVGEVIGEFPLKGKAFSILEGLTLPVDRCSLVTLAKLPTRDRIRERTYCRHQHRKELRKMNKK